MALAATLVIVCDGYSSGPEDTGLLTGTYTGEAEIIGVEILDVTLTLTKYLGGVGAGSFTAAGFHMGSSPYTGSREREFRHEPDLTAPPS